MKKRYLLILFILVGLLLILYFIFFSGKKNISARNSNLVPLHLTIEDSIPLYNDSLSFSYVNLQKATSDTILAYQYPALNLSQLNNKGQFIREISRKGDLKEQFISAFINPYFAADGKLYVMEEGNAPRLRVFDKNLNYLKIINLTDRIGYHYIPTLKSYFYIDFQDSTYQSLLLHVNIGSTLFHPSSKKLYEKDSSFATISIKNDEVQNVKLHVALNNFAVVKEALDKNKKTWDSPDPMFKFYNGFFYVKYEFDDSVYVYNKDWQPVKSYAIGSAFNYQGYSTPFEPIKDVNKSVASDYKMRYSNKYYFSVEVYGSKIFLLYYRPVNTDDIPATVHEDRKFVPTVILHVLDTKTLKESSCELPSFIAPYSKITAKSEDEIYLLGNGKIQEDIKIYKFKIQ